MAGYTIPFAVARERASPIRHARRDLVINAADDVAVQTTVYATETASAPAALTGTTARLVIADERGGEPLLTVNGVITGTAFVFRLVPSMTQNMIGRYAARMLLDFNGGVATLFDGILNIMPGGPAFDSGSPPYIPPLPVANVSDGVLAQSDIVVGVSDGTLSEDPGAVPVVSLSRTSVAFGDVLEDDTSPTQTVILSNLGTVPLVIGDIAISGEFDQTNDCGAGLAPSGTCTITISFTPTTLGAATGEVTITSNASPTTNTVALTGTGVDEVTGVVLHTSGNQILNAANDPVRLRSINWFGAEGTNYTPHGTWSRPYRDIIDQIADMGFNCVRIPLSGTLATPGLMPLSITEFYNPDLAGLTALEVLDALFDYFFTKGIMVVLDHHRREAGAGADGSPIGGSYTLTSWHDTWTVFANRYKNHPAVIGADLHNEPHDLEWDTWAEYAEDCAAVIHAIAPNWLIFVEGVGEYETVPYWWGGQLAGVADRPVVLGVANKLVYSPHEYGQSVASGQPWLAYEGGSPPVGWPTNLFAKWDSVWGFIFFDGIAPLWVGEFGGKFGIDGSGTDFTVANRDEERAWLATLTTYMNGDQDGDSDSDIGVVGGLGISYAYWSLNPNSGDTGGLLEDDWITEQTAKLALLATLLGE